MVEYTFPQVRLIVNQENVGFTRANNQAILASQGEFVLLLNSDTVVPSGALDYLLHCMNKHPRAGACGPRLLNADGSFQASFADFPSLRTEFIHQFGLASYLISSSYPSHPEDKSKVDCAADWVGGACLLVRRQCIEDVGLLDEEFVMYSEEMDWCYRMKQRNWQVWYCADPTIIHLGGRSSTGIPAWKYLQIQRSKVRFFQKHYGTISGFICTLAIKLSCLVKAATCALIYMFDNTNSSLGDRQCVYWNTARSRL